VVPLAFEAQLRKFRKLIEEPGTTVHSGEEGMSDVSGRLRPDFIFSESQQDESEVVVLDFSYSHWQLIEHRPDRARGVNPYNSAEPPPKQHQPWLRVGRR
jgi:hypothetical protein